MDKFEKHQKLVEALRDFGTWLGSHDQSKPHSYNHDGGPYIYRTFVALISGSYRDSLLLKPGAKPSEALFAGEFAKLTGQTCERVVFVSASHPFSIPKWMTADVYIEHVSDRFWSDLYSSMFRPRELQSFAFFLCDRKLANAFGTLPKDKLDEVSSRMNKLVPALVMAMAETMTVRVAKLAHEHFSEMVVDNILAVIETLSIAYLANGASDEATQVFRGYFQLLEQGLMLGIANVPCDHISGSERALLVLVR